MNCKGSGVEKSPAYQQATERELRDVLGLGRVNKFGIFRVRRKRSEETGHATLSRHRTRPQESALGRGSTWLRSRHHLRRPRKTPPGLHGRVTLQDATLQLRGVLGTWERVTAARSTRREGVAPRSQGSDSKGFTHPALLQTWESMARLSTGPKSIEWTLKVPCVCGKLQLLPARLD